MTRNPNLIPGLLIGAMWMGEIIFGNLGDTAVLGNIRTFDFKTYRVIGSLFIGGAIAFTTIMAITVLFRDALLLAPSNVKEFAGNAHAMFRDALGAGVNHLWIGPLSGVTLGGIGSAFGKWLRHCGA
jgi:hypothetical protein